MLTIEQITFELCKQRFVRALADYVGPGKAHSIQEVADTIDIELRTMRSYATGETLPPLPKLLRMMHLFGPGFANRLLHIAGLDGCFRQEADSITDFEFNADICNIVGDLGRALRDGRIDHRERPQLIDDARHLQNALQDWLALHDANSIGATPVLPDEIDTTAKPDEEMKSKKSLH